MPLTDPRAHRRSLLALPLLLAVCSVSAQDIELPTEACVATYGADQSTKHNFDWVSINNMSAEQRSKVPVNCCGAFIEPERNYQDANLRPEESALRVQSDSSSSVGDQATLMGDVIISQGFRQLKSDRALIDQASGKVELTGNIEFREPGLLILGEEAEVNIENRDIRLVNTHYVFHEGGVHGSAELLERTGEDVITITNTRYSTCQPGDSTWQLKTESVEIDINTGFATAKNAQLRVYDVPVLYIPWVRFPATDKRTSGLLFPSIESGSENGIDISQPIYWNIAANYDATFTPRIIQHRGLSLGTEFRHLGDDSKSTIQMAFLADDKGGHDDKDLVDGIPLHRGENRWSINADHINGIGKPFWQKVDFTKTSDAEYVTDFGTASIDSNSRTHLLQLGTIGYRTRHWNNQITVQQYQTIIADAQQQYRLAPRLQSNAHYNLGNVEFFANHEFTEFDHQDPNRITGSRIKLDYQLSYEKSWQWGYIKPAFLWRHLDYDLDRPIGDIANSSPSASVPGFSLDGKLFFERQSPLFPSLLQTLEPRFYYLHREPSDQSDFPDFDTRNITAGFDTLFSSDRFNGGDRIGDFQRLSLGITSRFIDKNGKELGYVNVGQAYHFRNRNVTLDNNQPINTLSRQQTPLAVNARADLRNNWQILFDAVYDVKLTTLDKNSIAARYKNSDNQLFNLGYRYTRAEAFTPGANASSAIKQIDVGAYLPLAAGWNLVSHWAYDVTFKRHLEIFAGFEYNSCCWRTSVVARHWLQRNDRLLNPQDELEHRNGVFFQIQFKGLAGTGTRVDRLIRDGIFGYEPRSDF